VTELWQSTSQSGEVSQAGTIDQLKQKLSQPESTTTTDAFKEGPAAVVRGKGYVC
jgi:hypothetical protein